MEAQNKETSDSFLKPAISLKINRKKDRKRFETEEFAYYPMDNFFYLEYSFYPEDESDTIINMDKGEMFYVLYCKEGEMILTDKSNTEHILRPTQSSIIYDTLGHGFGLKLKSGITNSLCVVGFSYPDFLTSEHDSFCYISLKQTFLKYMAKSASIFTDEPFCPVCDKVSELSDLKKERLINMHEAQCLVFEIIALKTVQIITAARNRTAENGFSPDMI